MITQRFRPLGWVAGVATAATMLYLISVQVAAERGRLEAIDAKIAMTKRDIRQLQTELGTRASLRQLERWNGEVLALSAPTAGQFLSGEAALASVDPSSLGRGGAAPAAMGAVMASSQAQAAAEAAPKPTYINQIAAVALDTPPPKMTKQDRAVQAAIKSKPQRVALVDRDMLDRRTLGELSRAANSEKSREKPRP